MKKNSLDHLKNIIIHHEIELGRKKPKENEVFQFWRIQLYVP